MDILETVQWGTTEDRQALEALGDIEDSKEKKEKVEKPDKKEKVEKPDKKEKVEEDAAAGPGVHRRRVGWVTEDDLGGSVPAGGHVVCVRWSGADLSGETWAPAGRD